MRKSFIYICFLFIITMSFCFTIPVKAYSISNVENNIYVLADPTDNINLDGYNQEQTCEGDNSILGNPSDPNSVAWLLQKIFDFIKILGPILVVLLSSFDFALVIIKSDDDSMTKAQKKLGTRLILAGLLFFVPTIVDVLLSYFGFYSTCGIR